MAAAYEVAATTVELENEHALSHGAVFGALSRTSVETRGRGPRF